ncbi:MAG: hypothetical protein RIQ93_985 [Verrucomicrobiota bacterium]|jgi:hypothetical protein
MKTTPAQVLLILILSMMTAPRASSAQPPPRVTNAGTHERAELKVLRVFAAQDGDAIFRAYLVEWKGQEVVAEDRLAKTDHQVGDTVSILVMRMPSPASTDAPELLHFSVLTPAPARETNKVGRG